jgi:hypothetical protein
MALKLADAVRNARLDAITTNVGLTAVLKIFGGTMPTNVTDADAGTALATINLADPYMNAAALGQKTKTGAWQDTSADTGGTATHFRLYAPGGTVCKIQGSITTTAAGTGDMLLDSTTVTISQPVVIGTFTLMDNNG